MKNKATYGLKLEDGTLSWHSVERRLPTSWQLGPQGRIALQGLNSSEGIPDLPQPAQIGMGILRSSKVKTAITKLPRFRGKEMERTVRGWAAREEGVAPEAQALTWAVIDDQVADKEMVTVFMAYADQAVVDDTMASYAQAGLRPKVLLPDFLILDQYLRSTQPELAGLQAWSLVHLDPVESFVCISSTQSALLHRSLPPDLSHGKDEAEYIKRLATEVSRSLSFARQTEQNPDIGSILISGEEHLVAQLVTELQSSQHIPVAPWNIDGLFAVEGGAPDSEAMIPLVAAMASTLGDSRYNLLPRARRTLLSPRASRYLLTGVAAVAAVAVPAFVAFSLVSEHRCAERLELARSHWATVEPAIAAATQADRNHRLALQREKTIEEHIIGADGLDNLLVSLAVSTPPQIRFESLKIIRHEDKTILQVSGDSTDDQNADAQKAFLAFVAALDGSEFLVRSPESGKLLIGELGQSVTRRKRVVFSLEYTVDTAKLREG